MFTTKKIADHFEYPSKQQQRNHRSKVWSLTQPACSCSYMYVQYYIQAPTFNYWGWAVIRTCTINTIWRKEQIERGYDPTVVAPVINIYIHTILMYLLYVERGLLPKGVGKPGSYYVAWKKKKKKIQLKILLLLHFCKKLLTMYVQIQYMEEWRRKKEKKKFDSWK